MGGLSDDVGCENVLWGNLHRRGSQLRLLMVCFVTWVASVVICGGRFR